MTTLVANVVLYNKAEYGRVLPGQVFQVRNKQAARELIRAGRAKEHAEAVPPVVAPEASARPGFRNVHLSDEITAELAPESDPVLPGADVPRPGVADSRKRRGKGKRTGRSEDPILP